MNIFLVNSDEPSAKTLIEKFCDAKDGSILPLTSEEMSLYNSDGFQVLSLLNENQTVTQVHPGNSYVFSCDSSNTVIDDILSLQENLNINVGIVRVNNG